MNQWYVIQSKPKKEREVENRLKAASFEVFLPLMKAIGTRQEARGLPLFPSYLFVRTALDDPRIHRLVRFTRGVSKILGDASSPVPLADFIIETLMARTRDGSLIEQELLFKEGDAVTVKRGILKDLQGIIERNIPEKGRIKVLFKWLNSSMRAVLRYRDLEKAA